MGWPIWKTANIHGFATEFAGIQDQPTRIKPGVHKLPRPLTRSTIWQKTLVALGRHVVGRRGGYQKTRRKAGNQSIRSTVPTTALLVIYIW
jgi:hypothetical protein